MSGKTESTQLAVIGAGPGGYAAAFHAADLGLETALIDTEENPGGVCLYRGCIPSKALLHVSKTITEIREQGPSYGVRISDLEIDAERMRKWTGRVVERLTGGLGTLCDKRKVRYIRGRARFRNARELYIESSSDSGNARLRFNNAIIATGSEPAALPGIKPGPGRVMDSTAALKVEDIPKKLLVVGGGYIGLELGTVYSALGSAVTVVEMTSGLLPGVDRDLVRPLARRLEASFKDIFLKTKIAEAKETAKGVRVVLEGEDVPGKNRIFDRVLLAVGRSPASENLGIENTGVELTERGFVKVDAARRTAEPHIYAIGDVAGEPMLAHKASHEGRTAVEAINGRDVVFEPRAIPAVVYTDPEIAWCGLTETRAKRDKRDVRVLRFPWSASGRAATLERSEGLTKIVVERSGGRILGMAVTGVGAGELIAEGVLAIEMGATAEDLALTIHPHPTLSESVMEAAEIFSGESTHLYHPRK
jgi:dihydrolipoamide dehydrogenase